MSRRKRKWHQFKWLISLIRTTQRSDRRLRKTKRKWTKRRRRRKKKNQQRHTAIATSKTIINNNFPFLSRSHCRWENGRKWNVFECAATLLPGGSKLSFDSAQETIHSRCGGRCCCYYCLCSTVAFVVPSRDRGDTEAILASATDARGRRTPLDRIPPDEIVWDVAKGVRAQNKCCESVRRTGGLACDNNDGSICTLTTKNCNALAWKLNGY